MADLIAQGPQNYHRWRREIPDPTLRRDLVIGRSEADWNVPWDGMISRAHVRLIPKPNDRIEIVTVSAARNPVYHQGRHATRFTLVPGDHFVIGKTTFTLAASSGGGAERQFNDGSGDAAVDVTESVFDHVALRRRHFRDVGSRIDVLTRLPDLIASSESDQELLVRVTSVLLQSTPSAESVSVLMVPDGSVGEGEDENGVEVLHYDNRSAALGGSPISRRLVRRAIEKRESILNVWTHQDSAETTSAFTAREDVDWAFCVPLRTEACRGWVIYITGQMPDAPLAGAGKQVDVSEALQDDVKFAELVGTTVASLRQSRRLQRRQAAMRHFFAPVVMQALATGDTDQVLQPRETDLTVMFCDLRGFSSRSERDAAQLLQLLSDVSDALGVMTKHILGLDGVIGDFHGDAAMGFWGWPLAQNQSIVQACRAALQIRQEFSASDFGFRCGIGLAHGRAVAGRIGTRDQVKVTAFGPVVNLASRLESMSKQFGAGVIIDETTRAGLLAQPTDESQPGHRVRRLAKVRPAGMSTALEISELLPALEDGEQQVDSEMVAQYETALDHFCEGEHDEALRMLRSLPTWDGPSQFLIKKILDGDQRGNVIDLPK